MSSHLFLSDSVAQQCIPDTDITNAFVIEKIQERLETLKECLADGGKIANIECEDITGLNGYLSRIYKYTIELRRLSDECAAGHLSVVLKLFSEKRLLANLKAFDGDNVMDNEQLEKLEEMTQRLRAIHNRECDVYERIGSLGLVPMANVYYLQRLDATTSGLIVMEDLTTRAYLDRFEEGLSLAKVENIVQHLAKLHTYTYSMGPVASAEWLSPFNKFLFEEDEGGEALREQIKQTALTSNPAAAASLSKLKKVIGNKDFEKFCFRTVATENGLPLVLVHGDLWTNNLLWEKADNGQELDEPAAFIDWQITFTGNPMADIARLLICCCESDVRRELDDSILHLYYDTVCRLMAEKGDGKRPSFTVANLRTAYEYMLVNQTGVFAFILPFFEKAWSPPPGTTLSEADKVKLDYKVARLKKRQAEASKDAVKILERIAPDWIDNSEE